MVIIVTGRGGDGCKADELTGIRSFLGTLYLIMRQLMGMLFCRMGGFLVRYDPNQCRKISGTAPRKRLLFRHIWSLPITAEESDYKEPLREEIETHSEELLPE